MTRYPDGLQMTVPSLPRLHAARGEIQRMMLSYSLCAAGHGPAVYMIHPVHWLKDNQEHSAPLPGPKRQSVGVVPSDTAATQSGGGASATPFPSIVAARHCISPLPESVTRDTTSPGVEARPKDHVPRHTSVALGLRGRTYIPALQIVARMDRMSNCALDLNQLRIRISPERRRLMASGWSLDTSQ